MESKGVAKRLLLGDGDEEFIAAGRHGWLYWRRLDGHDVRVRVRDVNGRLVIDALFVDSATTGAIEAADLRRLRLGRLERFINGPEVQGVVRAGISSATAESFEPIRVSLEKAAALASSLPEHRFRHDLHLPTDEAASGRSDSFYVAVARAHAQAAQQCRSPAAAIAGANDVPVTTVYRWLKEARRRGLIPSARRAAAP